MARDIFPFDEIALWHADAPPGGAGQMALDETMLRLAGRPTLRIYRWVREEVTFGYPQSWQDALRFAGARPITRRCTGGGLVEHGADVTVALAVPAAHPFSRLAPAETYRHVHEAIRVALRAEDLRLAQAEDRSDGPTCFANPAADDVLSAGRKIAGGAQRRSRDGLLYQGSVQNIVVDGNFCGRLSAALAASIAPWNPPAGWESVRDELVRTRYGSSEWNRRR